MTIGGELVPFGLAISSFVTGDWAVGLGLLFPVMPIWWFVSDLATALLFASVALVAAGEPGREARKRSLGDLSGHSRNRPS